MRPSPARLWVVLLRVEFAPQASCLRPSCAGPEACSKRQQRALALKENLSGITAIDEVSIKRLLTVIAMESVPLSRHGFIFVGASGSGPEGGERCASSIFLGQTGFCALSQDFPANSARREAHSQRLTVRRPVHFPSPSSALVRNSLPQKIGSGGQESIDLAEGSTPRPAVPGGVPRAQQRRTERTWKPYFVTHVSYFVKNLKGRLVHTKRPRASS